MFDLADELTLLGYTAVGVEYGASKDKIKKALGNCILITKNSKGFEADQEKFHYGLALAKATTGAASPLTLTPTKGILKLMSASTRRKFGALLAVLAVAVLPALAFAGVPLITRDSAYFVERGATTSSVHLHWPVAALFIAGLGLILFPRRDHAG